MPKHRYLFGDEDIPGTNGLVLKDASSDTPIGPLFLITFKDANGKFWRLRLDADMRRFIDAHPDSTIDAAIKSHVEMVMEKLDEMIVASHGS